MGMIGNSLAQGLISGANIQDGTVDTPDIKDGAVHTAKVADAAVHTAKIADGAVTAAKIADGAAVPSQTGQTGKYLTTDGTTASWGTVDLTTKVSKTGDTMTGGLNTHSANPVIDYESGYSMTFGSAFKAPSGSSRAAAFISGSSGDVSCWWVNNSNEAVGAIDGATGGAGLSIWSQNGTAWQRGLSVLPDSLVAFDGDITTGGVFRGKTPFMQVEMNNGARAYPDGTSNVYYNQITRSQGGVGHNSNFNFTFTHPGFYRLTTTYRYGTGGDVWTSMQLVSGGTVLGRSHGTGQTANDPATSVFDFVADVGSSHVGTNLQLQFLRSGSGFTISNTGHGAELITIVQWMGA